MVRTITVLDSSALFSMEDVPSDLEAYTTPGVLEELAKYHDSRAEYLQHKLRVQAPSSQCKRKVEKAAKETGDSSRLSAVDVEVVALALELKAVLYSDDYSIQNICRKLNVPYQAVGTKGITKLVRWRYRCTGCGKVYDHERPDCLICGAPLRTTRAKR